MTTTTLDAAGAPPAHEPIVTARTYGFVAFLMLLNVFNILDRQLLPTFANEIKADLHLSNGQFGLLSGIAEVAERLAAHQGGGHQLRGLLVGRVAVVDLQVVLHLRMRVRDLAVDELGLGRQVAQLDHFIRGQDIFDLKKHQHRPADNRTPPPRAPAAAAPAS